jgi:hypothetical protein
VIRPGGEPASHLSSTGDDEGGAVANGLIEADRFELNGEGATITYDRRTRELHYQGPTQPPLEDFVEVTETAEPVETPIGTLVTAMLDAVEDGDSRTVTVVLPDVRLLAGGSGYGTFDTVAIFATVRSSLGGPGRVEGPGQLYVSAGLQGTARLAEAS